ncbi:MAG TPA: hypothetical protein VJY47_00290 [Candidatus Dojkabacteria bacterium]|nr:hypothetical protein [Candidatus Dojkabacteria bacterium]
MEEVSPNTKKSPLTKRQKTILVLSILLLLVLCAYLFLITNEKKVGDTVDTEQNKGGGVTVTGSQN